VHGIRWRWGDRGVHKRELQNHILKRPITKKGSANCSIFLGNKIIKGSVLVIKESVNSNSQK